MRVRRILVLGGLVAAVLVGPLSGSASAGVSATTGGGTTLNITMTGDGTANISCVLGLVTVNGTAASPGLSCSSLKYVSIVGDAGNQTADLRILGDSAFPLHPTAVVSLGDGSDTLTDGPYADTIDLGGNDDDLTLVPGGATNGSVNMGTGLVNRLHIDGTDDGESITATSTNTVVNVNVVGPTPMNQNVAYATNLSIEAGGGNDTVTASGITAGSSLTYRSLSGGPGDDVINGSPVNDGIYGGSGTNILHGGGGTDALYSDSDDDTLDPGADAVIDYLYERSTLHSGTRSFLNVTAQDDLDIQANTHDVVSRIRPGSSPGEQVWTVSLNRSGQYVLPSGKFGTLGPSHFTVGAPNHRTITDVVAGPREVYGGGGNGGLGLLDVTVPSGSWTTNVTNGGATVKVTPANSAYKPVTGYQLGTYRVHGPWSNKDQGWAHRATRDLLFRFPTDAARDQIRDQLASHAKTRAQVTASLMSTDEYRGLDVDRSFLDYLRRAADPSGRTYWITSIRNGKSLRQFRAQLFGSNEYFTKAGGTNQAFVVRAYNDVLGRDPDAGGLTYWTNKLNDGTERGLVARQFLSSTEARRNIVKEQFRRFIDRLPTTGEASTWVATLGSSSTGEQDLVAFLANSSTYYLRD